MALSCLQKVCAVGHLVCLLSVTTVLVSPDWVEIKDVHSGDREPRVRVGLILYCETETKWDDYPTCHFMQNDEHDFRFPAWFQLCRFASITAIYLLLITNIINVGKLCTRLGSSSVTQGFLTLHAAVLVTITTALVHQYNENLVDIIPKDSSKHFPYRRQVGLRWLSHVADVSAGLLLLVGIVTLFAPRRRDAVSLRQKAEYVLLHPQAQHPQNLEAPPEYGTIQTPPAFPSQ